MSDLISRSMYKSKLIKALDVLDKDYREAILNEDNDLILAIQNQQSAYMIALRLLDNEPTAYSVDKVVEELNELDVKSITRYKNGNFGNFDGVEYYIKKRKAIEIVKQEAEKFGTDINVVSNGWIPCSERLPEEPFGCLVTVIDCEPVTQTDFENILPYFVGYDGESWNDEDGNEIPFEVIAWQPLPEPFKECD